MTDYKYLLRGIDHDCRSGDPDDGCRTCSWINDLTEDQAKAHYTMYLLEENLRRELELRETQND